MAERYDPADLRVAVIFLRAIRGWDQAELAAAAGVPPSSISRCESGKSNLSPKSFERIVSAAGVPASTTERLFRVIRSARAAVAGAAATDLEIDSPEAIAAEICDELFEVVRSAAELMLADFVDEDEPEPEAFPGASPRH
jgi:transcriptional regulator with XRE-family HTH domain